MCEGEREAFDRSPGTYSALRRGLRRLLASDRRGGPSPSAGVGHLVIRKPRCSRAKRAQLEIDPRASRRAGLAASSAGSLSQGRVPRGRWRWAGLAMASCCSRAFCGRASPRKPPSGAWGRAADSLDFGGSTTIPREPRTCASAQSADRWRPSCCGWHMEKGSPRRQRRGERGGSWHSLTCMA